ncbi:MAG: excinuclease ABC subunit UvrA [Candidatus Moraniibacteriota bacterium]
MPGKKSVIEIRGARVNNLKNVDIDIPRDALVVVTGLSGSGKSSLAFDTLYAEANRRYVESLSAYARNFMEGYDKPDVDTIRNLSPAISIDQKSVSRSPRSTVGTMTEVYDYLRLLFAKVGKPHCPKCHQTLSRKTAVAILGEILALPNGSNLIFVAESPLLAGKNWEQAIDLIDDWGFVRVWYRDAAIALTELHTVVDLSAPAECLVIVDRLVLDTVRPDKERMLDSIHTGFQAGHGVMRLFVDGKHFHSYHERYRCEACQIELPEFSPAHFSFNSPEGACPTCGGLGVTLEFDPALVIPNDTLSISEGAIRPWSKMNSDRGNNNGPMSLLREMAKRERISLDIPVKKLSEKQREYILRGDAKCDLTDEFGFPGVLGLLERKYRETKSDHLRAEIETFMFMQRCPECQGKRLRSESLSVYIGEKNINDFVGQSIEDLRLFFKELRPQLLTEGEEKSLVEPLFSEMEMRLSAVDKVGLGYLSLSRSADTLSGGEAQRIRLSVQIKSGLSGIIYVLDEPSVGLHSRDTDRLIRALEELRGANNSLVVVEHDVAIMRKADWIIDLGPGAGKEGGEIIFSGTPEKLMKSKLLTGQYLSGKRSVMEHGALRDGSGKSISIEGATEHNLKDVTVEIPLGKFVSVSGVSGSGKSTLVHDILSRSLSKHFYQARTEPGAHRALKGIEHIDKVITVTQDAIGRTPRSNAATYTGIFSLIRDVFAATPEAEKERYSASYFSFNMRGGRCEVCQGGGLKKIEMYLLPDVYIPCEVCNGTRYNAKTLAIQYRGMNISEVLRMTVTEARHFFLDQPMIEEKLRVLEEVGLGYLVLGQSAPNLSGGEAQRIKLATELARKSTGKTLYILDEPTIGLHFEDVRRLLEVLNALVDKGNTVIVVEHNIDVIRSSDWVIDMGPDGGGRGGMVVYSGIPEKLKKIKASFTGRYL